ncbi:MAG: hypothetical protein AAF566_13385 [Pseudomonadota bacterium]
MIPAPPSDRDFPWWLVVAGAIGVYLAYRVVADDIYRQVLSTLSKGVGITVFVTLVSFFAASGLGLLLAVASLSRFVAIRQIARFYIEIVRGIPSLSYCSMWLSSLRPPSSPPGTGLP